MRAELHKRQKIHTYGGYIKKIKCELYNKTKNYLKFVKTKFCKFSKPNFVNFFNLLFKQNFLFLYFLKNFQLLLVGIFRNAIYIKYIFFLLLNNIHINKNFVGLSIVDSIIDILKSYCKYF